MSFKPEKSLFTLKFSAVETGYNKRGAELQPYRTKVDKTLENTVNKCDLDLIL